MSVTNVKEKSAEHLAIHVAITWFNMAAALNGRGLADTEKQRTKRTGQ
jgi:hypothetical protein